MAPHANDANGESTGTHIEQVSVGQSSEAFTVTSPNVQYSDTDITSKYAYRTTDVSLDGGKYVVTPKETLFDFKTERKVGKVGVMLVGWVSDSIVTTLQIHTNPPLHRAETTVLPLQLAS